MRRLLTAVRASLKRLVGHRRKESPTLCEQMRALYKIKNADIK